MKKYGMMGCMMVFAGSCLGSAPEENRHKSCWSPTPEPVVIPESTKGGGWWIPSDQYIRRRKAIKPMPKQSYVDPVKK